MLAQLPPALQSLQLPLRLKLWDGHEFDLGPRPQVTIVVKDPQLISQLTHPSLDELGAAFVEGKLELEGTIGEVIRVCDELSQALLKDEEDDQPVRREHDKATDAAAISYHYDLSNDFYQLWLDRDMAYSCAYFKQAGDTLEQAQQNKFEHLCRKLRVQPGDYLLDVGCGWGGLSRYAARAFGAKVFGITLSKEQLELARERVKAEGLESKFIGKNFVFDDRMGERITDDIIAHCHLCGSTCDDHINCANEDCHLLFIQCGSCSEKLNGCCSEACKDTLALPLETRKSLRKGKIKTDTLSVYRKSRIKQS